MPMSAEPNGSIGVVARAGAKTLPVRKARVPEPGATRRRPAEVRRLLLDAAERVAVREGRAVTMHAIAAEAGVARSALYRHFPDRDQLLAEAALAPFVDFREAFRVAAGRDLEQYRTVYEMERAFVGAILDHFAEHRDFVASVLSERSVLDPRVRSQLVESIDEVIEEISGVAKELGVVYGVPLESIDTWVRLVIALVTGIATNSSWLLPRGAAAWSRAELVDKLTTFILYGIQTPPAN